MTKAAPKDEKITMTETAAAPTQDAPPPPSQTFSYLAAALAKAQGQMEAAKKDRENPHFKSTYATLHSIREAGRKALSDCGIAVVQITSIENGSIILKTTLLHTSGESVTGDYPVCSVNTPPQSIGSAMTYARKNSLAGMTGIAPVEDPDDDDGNKAQAAAKANPPQRTERVERTPNPPQPSTIQGARPTLQDQAVAYINKVEQAKTWGDFMAVIADAGDLVERIRATDKSGRWVARINEVVGQRRDVLEPTAAPATAVEEVTDEKPA